MKNDWALDEVAIRAAFEKWRFLVKGEGDWLAVAEAIRAYLSALPQSPEDDGSRRQWHKEEKP